MTAPIFGAKTMKQFDENMGAVGWELSATDMETLDAASQYAVPYPYNMINRCNARFQQFK